MKLTLSQGTILLSLCGGTIAELRGNNHDSGNLNMNIQMDMSNIKTEMTTQKANMENVHIATSSVGGSFLDGEFENWIQEHSKLYESLEERAERFQIWMENHILILRHNTKIPKPSYTLGHNQFSDMTNEEYQEYNRLGSHSPGVLTSSGDYESYEAIARRLSEKEEDISSNEEKNVDLPNHVDWVKEGAVTEVKNQGKCGSCWAFSATGSLESSYYLKTGKLVSFSTQQLVDCDSHEHGCQGGLMDPAFVYDETAGGLCTFEDYPYVATQHTCDIECTKVPGSAPESYVDVDHSADALMAALAKQPVSVAIQANQMKFQLYKEGVFDELCFQKIDHGVVAVGYGTDEESGLDYWKIKNSWGEKWGDAGYIRIARSSLSRSGRCGILLAPSYPVM